MVFKFLQPVLCGFVVLLLSSFSWASSLKYSTEPLTGSMGSGVLPHGEEFILRSKLEKIHVWPVSEMRSSLTLIPEVDQLYTSTDNNRAVLAKFGLRPTEKELVQKILPMGEYFLYHTQVVRGGTPVAMAFVGFTEKEVRAAVQHIEARFWTELQDRILNRWGKYALIQTMIRPACAQTAPACTIDDNLAQIGKVNAQTFATTVGQHMLRCLAQAGSGAVQSSKGLWESVKQAATNPKAFWDSKVKEFMEIKNFLTNMGDEIRGFWNALKSIDPAIIPDIACTLAGQIAGDFIAKLAIGGGVAALGVKLVSLLGKLKSGVKTLEVISKLKAAGQLKDASGPIRAILENQIPDEMANILQKFAKTNPAAVKKVLQCF